MKKLLLLILIYSYGNSYCYYVSCASSVVLATAITTSNIETMFGKINIKLNEVKNAHKSYDDVIKKNNDLYDKNIKLKIEYLLTLQEIKQKQELLKNKRVVK